MIKPLTLLRNGMRYVGFEIVRAQNHADLVHKPFYLLGFLIAELVRQSEGEVTFVQVGAADGVLGDPLRPVIVRHRLRGLLIEPVPSSFAKLRENYADQPQVLFANCAVASEPGMRTMHGFDANTNDIGTHRMSSLFAGNPASRGMNAKRASFEVPVRTLPELLDEHGIACPSILVVDVEGLDAEIVNAALGAGLRPSIIMYEHVYLPVATQNEARSKLRDAGYSFIEADVDTYAVSDALCEATGCLYT